MEWNGIVALGKTGAQELNYISDVDVLYIAEAAVDEDGEPVCDTDGLRLSVHTHLGAAELASTLLGRFNAQNLLTFSNCSFIDPESSEFGSNMNSGGANSGRNYPNLRYFGAGLNITF